MEIFNIDPVVMAVMLGMVAGLVEFIRHAWTGIFTDWKEWKTCLIIAVAGGTGAITAAMMGLNPLVGAVVGFAASGYVTIAQNVGKK